MHYGVKMIHQSDSNTVPNVIQSISFHIDEHNANGNTIVSGDSWKIPTGHWQRTGVYAATASKYHRVWGRSTSHMLHCCGLLLTLRCATCSSFFVTKLFLREERRERPENHSQEKELEQRWKTSFLFEKKFKKESRQKNGNPQCDPPST